MTSTPLLLLPPDTLCVCVCLCVIKSSHNLPPKCTIRTNYFPDELHSSLASIETLALPLKSILAGAHRYSGLRLSPAGKLSALPITLARALTILFLAACPSFAHLLCRRPDVSCSREAVFGWASLGRAVQAKQVTEAGPRPSDVQTGLVPTIHATQGSRWGGFEASIPAAVRAACDGCVIVNYILQLNSIICLYFFFLFTSMCIYLALHFARVLIMIIIWA